MVNVNSKEDRKKHIEKYKESILFYSPYLIIVGLLFIEIGTLLFNNGSLFISFQDIIILLILPVLLIIFEYRDQSDYFIIATVIGFFVYGYFNVYGAAISYILKTADPIATFGIIILFLGFLFCFLLYSTVMRRVLSKNKLQGKIDEMKEEYNQLDEDTYIIGKYLCGIKDVKNNLPCLIYIDNKDLKAVFVYEQERISKVLDINTIDSITYRSCSGLNQHHDSYLSLNPSFFLLPKDPMQRMIWKNSLFKFDTYSSTKVDIQTYWEVRINYNNEMFFLVNVYDNPEKFVSNFMESKEKQ